MSSTLSKRNNSIDIFRLVIAVVTVACHSNIFIDINSVMYNILSRYSVRFIVAYFLIVSGYFYIKSLIENKANFNSWFFSALKTYAVWTLIYYSLSFVTSVIIGGEPIDRFFIERVIFFFIDGSYYHFWYFLALLYSILLTTIIHKFFKEKGILIFAIISIIINVIAILGTGYSFIGDNIPFLAPIYSFPKFHPLVLICAVGFSSFTAGYFIYLIKKGNFIKAKASLVLLLVSSVLYMAEILFLVLVMKSTDNPYAFFMVYPLAICLLLVFINHPMPKYTKFANLGRKVSGFIYFVHPLVLVSLKIAFDYLNLNVNSILVFLIAITIIIPVTFIFVKLDNGFTRTLMGIDSKIKK